MIINETNKQMIREIVVELFKEITDPNNKNNEVFYLEQHLHDIISDKVDKYEVNVYGVSLQEKL